MHFYVNALFVFHLVFFYFPKNFLNFVMFSAASLFLRYQVKHVLENMFIKMKYLLSTKH